MTEAGTNPGGWVGGAPPPGFRMRGRAPYPTTSHFATQIAPNLPPRYPRFPARAKGPANRAGCGRRRALADGQRFMQRRVCVTLLADFRRFRPPPVQDPSPGARPATRSLPGSCRSATSTFHTTPHPRHEEHRRPPAPSTRRDDRHGGQVTAPGRQADRRGRRSRIRQARPPPPGQPASACAASAGHAGSSTTSRAPRCAGRAPSRPPCAATIAFAI